MFSFRSIRVVLRDVNWSFLGRQGWGSLLASRMIVGVALDYLPLFVEENGGRAKVGEMTTADVKQYIVKIQTASSQETYCQRIVRQSVTSPDKAHYVGEATWFVIHHWKSKFINLVDSLLTHFAFDNAKDKVYLWIDLFCYNQHTKEDKNPTWFQTTLNDVISVTKNTILIIFSSSFLPLIPQFFFNCVANSPLGS